MELINYLLKVSLCSGLFYLFYALVLNRLTFFGFNRIYLLLSLLLSFAIPAVQLTIEREAKELVIVQQPLIDDESTGNAVKQIQSNAAQLNGTENKAVFSWEKTLPIAYLVMMAIGVGIMCWRLVKLWKLTKGDFQRVNGLKLIAKADGLTNCSFFSYVFIDRNGLTATELEILLKHEAVHAQKWHSVDKILLMVAKAVLWFNPIIYLYDKALEQVHEYEADENTSLTYGNNAYATLLLRLATHQVNTPLVHNFVKSPIKERIKMLFHAKSKNMKKLTYLLALPIAAGLLWCLSIEVVYALPQHIQPQQVVPRKKELALPNKPNPYLESAAFKAKMKKADSLRGKVVKGTIGADVLPDKGRIFFGGKIFKVGNENYILTGLPKEGLPSIKEGDVVTVRVAMMSFSENDDRSGIHAATIEKNGVVIYTKPQRPLVKYPFLYEANKVRFNDPVLTAINNKNNGKELLLKQNGFTFTLSINKSQTDDADYIKSLKVGDTLRLRFIHEVKTGNKSYTIKDWLSISKNIRTFGMINEGLFYKFYHTDGSQKINRKPAAIDPANQKAMLKPRLISSTLANVDNKNDITYALNPYLEVGEAKVRGNEMVWDRKKGILSVKKPVITEKNGEQVQADSVVWDLSLNKSTIFGAKTKKVITSSATSHLPANLKYSVRDSVSVEKATGKTTLYGKVRLDIGSYILTADRAVVDPKTNTVNCYVATLKEPGGLSLRADLIRFNMVTKKYTDWDAEIRH